MITFFLTFLLVSSPGTSFLKSLLIPGYSQIKGGNKRGYVYLVMEGASLFYLFQSKLERDRMKEDARVFAYTNAGCNLPADINETWNLVERYPSFDAYIEYLYREARQYYPDDPEAQDQYVREKIPSFSWEWNGFANFYTFQDKMSSYRSIGNRMTALMGFILLNHLASGIDAFISEKIGSKKVKVSLHHLPERTDLVLFYKF